jgi:hypothetical protein
MNKHAHCQPTAPGAPRVARLAGWIGLGLITAALPAFAAGDLASVSDAQDLGDSSGDIRAVSAWVRADHLYLSMTVEAVAAPSVEQTPEGKSNRYYYHWLLDTDNNPATGRSNAEYEGNPTGVTKPVGAERVVQIGWRNGLPDGIDVYDPLNDEVKLVTGFHFQASGNTLTAVLPLSALGLSAGQTIGISAFQEGASDGWAVDWIESDTLTLGGLATAAASVADGQDLGDSSGDIRAIGMQVLGGNLYFSMTVEAVAAPATEQTPEGKSNRYYYHWLLDTDNNPATGRSNSEYENNPTGVQKPVGAERVVQIGWRNGLPDGIDVYDPLNDEVKLITGFAFQARGNSLTAVIPLAELGLTAGQTIAFSAFQEGASDGWAVDWMESATLALTGPAVSMAAVKDPADLGDTSGDIRAISAHVEGTSLRLSLTVEAVAAPSTEQTPEGKSNRYYYHWLLDTDNNPATGRSNAEYEGNPTGVTKPVGADRVVQIGWRNGQPDGIDVYDPLNDEVKLVTGFAFQASGNTLTTSIPLASLGLTVGQTIAVSAFQEGASDGWAVDWMESASVTLEPPVTGRMKIDGQFQDWTGAAGAGLVTGVDDPQDLGDSSGDIRRIEATVENGYLYVRMNVEGIALPSVEETPEGKSNRYYYHWLVDTDNNPATGRSNAEYENSPTGVVKPVGAERVIQIGWRNGAPDGVNVYDALDDEHVFVSDFDFDASGNAVEARIKLSDLGLVLGQTIALSAFQEGASDGWAVDWMESAGLTLTEGGPGGMTIENQFAGDPVGFAITVQDSATEQVDPATVVVRSGGEVVEAMVNKNAGVTTITGSHPALLTAGTLHTVALSLKAAGKTQSKDFVFKVEPYTVLPTAGSLNVVNQSHRGFVANVTMISGAQSQVTSLHSNLVSLAEEQLTGTWIDPLTTAPYYNEAEQDWSKWLITPVIADKAINWYELAPDSDALLNFPNSDPIPHLSGSGLVLQGAVVEILTYVELPAGYHKLGLYTEGGHKATAGFKPGDPLLSVLDNEGGVERVPSYYARNQFFDVVAPEAGYYPLRLLWFQSRRNQEPGFMLEVFSVKDRALQLLNDSTNPKSLRAFRAGPLLGSGSAPTLSAQRQGANLNVSWTGMLQTADSINGPWSDYADQSQSPLGVPMNQGAKCSRARGYGVPRPGRYSTPRVRRSAPDARSLAGGAADATGLASGGGGAAEAGAPETSTRRRRYAWFARCHARLIFHAYRDNPADTHRPVTSFRRLSVSAYSRVWPYTWARCSSEVVNPSGRNTT